MADSLYFSSVGRRKTAVARVRLIPGGNGTILINGRPYAEYLTRATHQGIVTQPLRVTESLDKFNVVAKVSGGGLTGWAGAVSHAIARALVRSDEELRKTLRRFGLLTRDPRVKERKKYGLKRARKAPQYTKR